MTTTFQTVDKVHGMRRGFFFTKVSQTQYLSRLKVLFWYNRSIKVGDGDYFYDDF